MPVAWHGGGEGRAEGVLRLRLKTCLKRPSCHSGPLTTNSTFVRAWPPRLPLLCAILSWCQQVPLLKRLALLCAILSWCHQVPLLKRLVEEGTIVATPTQDYDDSCAVP